MARKGRKPKSADQKLRDALERQAPPLYVLERRRLFSFVQPPSKDRLDGRNGEIDSEVCDAIGQLCALGYFDDHGHDPIEMRDKGRFWGGHYAKLFKASAVRTGSYEPRSRSTATTGALTKDDLMFDRMDEPLPDYERQVLLSLIVDPLIGTKPDGEFAFWAQDLIDEALFKRGKFRAGVMRVGKLDANHEAYLAATIRGLCVLIDGALSPRWERAA